MIRRGNRVALLSATVSLAGSLAFAPLPAAAGSGTAPPGRAAAASPSRSVNLGPTRRVQLPDRSARPAAIEAARREELAAGLSRINRHPRWSAPAATAGGGTTAHAAPQMVVPGSAAPPAAQPAPTAMEFYRNTDLTQASVGGRASNVDEPAVSNDGNVVFYTGNWYAAVSNDAGNSFTFIDPFTAFPSQYRGFCCDQGTIYDPSRNLTIWSLLYTPNAAGSALPGLNAIRIAVANGQSGVTNGQWHYWNLQATQFGFNSTNPYAWLDYPQLALSSNFLYVTANVFQGTATDPDCSGAPADCSQLGSLIVRLPLGELAGTSGQSLLADSYSAGCGMSFCVDTLTPVTQAGSVMYFAGDPGTATTPDTTRLRIFSWPESAPAPVSFNDIGHAGYNYMFGSDGVCTDPGNHNPCARDDSRVRTGWVSGGLLSFMWDVKQGGVPPGTGSSNPYPFVQGVTVDTASGMSLVSQPSFYSSTSAFVYESVAANGAGNLGLTMTQAGGALYPSVVSGIHDDVNAPNWTFNTLLSGTGGPNRPEWGDYVAARSDSGSGETWLVTGFAIVGTDTSTGSSPDASLVPVFAWFGRARDDPFTASGLRCSTEAATPGGTLGNTALATFTARSGVASEYSASVDFGDGTAATPGAITGQGTSATVSQDHLYTTAGQYTMTVTVSDKIGSQVSCQSAVQVGYLFSVASRGQYSLPNSDGQTWMDMDARSLSITIKPLTNIDAVLSGNADLWTAANGYNQDLAVTVNGTVAAWKESGGFAGTGSPNAAFVQTKISLTAGITYNFRLQWKSNRATNNNGATIFAGAGPIAGLFSPTRLTVELMTPTPAMTVNSQSSQAQYQLPGSNGITWSDLAVSSGSPTPLTINETPLTDGTLVLSGNADLWTSSAGYNQDLGIFVAVNGALPALVGWKESGGFAGTFSPNAAFVQHVIPVTAGTQYAITLKWKTNKADPGSIFAGAGPTAGNYSPTTLTAVFIPQGATLGDNAPTSQFQLANSSGSLWQALGNPNPPIASTSLALNFRPANNCQVLVGGNADLWTSSAGYNQDIGIAVSGGIYPTTNGQPEAWKESGGFAGTFSPNAAFVQAVLPLQANTTYNFSLQWKTNVASGTTIFAGAGNGPAFSETEITLQPFGC